MGNCDEKHTEIIKCPKCGTENEVDVISAYDAIKDEEESLELAEYTQCSNCKRELTTFDLHI